MGYTYDKVTGQWYETDDKGNMIYTSERPENMTGVYERSYNTGEMLDDPSTMRSNYIVKNKNDRKGNKSTSKPGLVPRSKVIKTPPTTTVTPPSSQNESRTKTWFELPDGTRINEQFTDWQT